MTTRFIVTRAPGPVWNRERPTREQAGWDPHASFMDMLVVERFLAFGGPAGEESKFVLIADALDVASVRARLASDPWAAAGLLQTVAIDPWTIWLGGDELLAAARDRKLYLVGYGPGPDWEQAKERREQTGWKVHGEFMDALTEQRRVVLGGPIDERHALVVVQFDDEAALRARLAADPWYGGVLEIESVEPWTLWLSRGREAAAG